MEIDECKLKKQIIRMKKQAKFLEEVIADEHEWDDPDEFANMLMNESNKLVIQVKEVVWWTILTW